MRTLLASSALVLSACLASPSSECFEVPTPAELRGGGWDANGRTLGAELEALALLDEQGREVALVDGRLRGPSAAIDRGTVVLRGAGAATTIEIELVRSENGVPLYDARVEGSAVCDGLAAFVPGSWSSSGAHVATGVTLACEHGAIAKCALWGYAPWVVGEAEHAACTRMVRADYCGDGASWTRDGTPIAHADIVELAALDASGGALEAGWGESGAVCVHASRWDVTAPDGSAVLPPCWATLPRCATPEAAIDAGALLVSRARPETLAACR